MSDNVLTIDVGGREFQSFEAAADHLFKQLEAAPNRAAQKVTRELRQMLQRVAAEMQKRHSSAWNGQVVNNSDNLQRRSGDGLQSIRDSIRVRGGARLEMVEGGISTGTLAIHETGGTITAKRSRYLTIPLPAALDSRGVPLRRSARDWDNTFCARSRKGNLIIFQRRGKDIVPLYVLKTSVTIKPRLGLEAAVMGALPYFQERMLDIIAAEIDQL